MPDQVQLAAESSTQSPWELYSPRERQTFLFVLFLVGTSHNIDRNIIGVLLEQIKAEFQISDTLLGMLSGLSFALVYATLAIPIARWADRGDRKSIITLSLSVWNLMTVCCGLATGFWQLAMARFGVGTGEAGANAPAQSLLADYYPPVERARALGIFLMSSSAGYALGLVLGGYVAQNFGWRAAFLVIGLLGAVLAPLTHICLKEPRRIGKLQVVQNVHESMLVAVRILFAKASYRNILMALVLYFLMSNGAFAFIVSFMIRVHGLSVAQAGASLGIIATISAVIGNLVGGTFADRMARIDISWLGHLSGWGMIALVPVFQLALWSPNLYVAMGLFLLAFTLINGLVPSMFSALHVICGSKRRAVAVAIAYLFANLIGWGLGPVLAGSLSDGFAANVGKAQGLRFALMAVMNVLFLAGWFMLRAAPQLKAEAEA
jgi:predicted MFS family arabinose efflux permease